MRKKSEIKKVFMETSLPILDNLIIEALTDKLAFLQRERKSSEVLLLLIKELFDTLKVTLPESNETINDLNYIISDYFESNLI